MNNKRSYSNVYLALGSLIPLTLISCNNSKQVSVKKGKKPNVIFIYADDLGIGDLSCYGANKIHTPNIDHLASQGIQFTNAYATSSISTPSRFGLLTGMYPWRQKNTGVAPGNSELLIDSTCVTMADMFQNAGYKTGVVGKWHLGLGKKGGTDFNKLIKPNAQSIGFDYEFVIPATVDRVPCVYVENGRVAGLDPKDPITVSYTHKVGNWPTGKENPELLKLKPSQGHNNTIINGIPRIGWMTGGKSALWVDEDIADVLTAKATNFISKHKNEPFFLYMGTQDVHVPRIPHARFKGKSGLGDRGDVILQLDWTIGQIIHVVDSLNIADNTMIIFTSDNGPVIDDGYYDEAFEKLNGHTPMGIYRGGKYSVFEAGTRIPFIIKWPKKIQPAKQQALFSQIDVYSSLAHLLNQKIAKEDAPDSRNQLNVLLGKGHDDVPFIIEHNVNNTLSIQANGWKYIEPSKGPAIEFYTKMELGNSPKEQLYHLTVDPCETKEVSAENPKITAKLRALLQKEKNKKCSIKHPEESL